MTRRVLQALTSGGTGGTERMVSSLVERLDRSRVESVVSVLDNEGLTTDDLRAKGVTTHVLGGRGSYVGAVRRLAKLATEQHIDTIHAYGFRMSLVARAALPLMPKRPTVIHGIRGLHLGDWPDATSPATRLALRLERAGSRWVDLYVANSPAAIRFLTSAGLPEERFRLIPNGVDLSYWTPRETPRASRGPLFVSIANFRPVKRLDLIVAAASVLRDRHPEARMLLVGDGPLRSALEAQVAALGVQHVVTFAGALGPDRVRELLRDAAGCLLTSAWEGMPVSLLEAMACGCPVIGTAVPGIRDVVDHEDTGLLCPPDAEAIAAACGRLLDAPETADQLRTRARARVAGRYSVERMVADHEALYATMAREGSR